MLPALCVVRLARHPDPNPVLTPAHRRCKVQVRCKQNSRRALSSPRSTVVLCRAHDCVLQHVKVPATHTHCSIPHRLTRATSPHLLAWLSGVSRALGMLPAGLAHGTLPGYTRPPQLWIRSTGLPGRLGHCDALQSPNFLEPPPPADQQTDRSVS